MNPYWTRSLPILLIVSIYSLLHLPSRAQTQVSKIVCPQYPEIEDDFTSEKQNYHHYYVESLICNSDEFKTVTKDLIYSILLKDVRYVAPTFNNAQVQNCGKVILNLGAISVDLKSFGDYLPGNDPIVTLINKNSYSVVNYTLPDHRLHAGKVVRSIVQRGKQFLITTEGTGNNLNAVLGKVNKNQTAMDMIWHGVDIPFIEDARKILRELNHAKDYYGVWKGKIKYGSIQATDNITVEIKPDQDPSIITLTLHTIKSGKPQVEILKGTMSGTFIKTPFKMPYKNRSNGFCNGFLFFQKENENIIADFGTDDENCESIHIVLNKNGISDQVTPLNTSKTFKINSKDVTLSTDKDFKWYKWDNAPEDLKTAAGFIHSYKNRLTQKDVLLSDEISEYLADKSEVKIAAVDLDGDGVCGLTVFVEGSTWCGTAGCKFELFDNGGFSKVDLGIDHGPAPAQNGVKASTGRFFQLKPNNIIPGDQEAVKNLFKYDKPNKVVPPTPPAGPLTGGSTPFELARLLLKALQTNDKKLWISCIHPEASTEFRQELTDRFTDFREGFTGQGVENWKLITFSRVGFQSKIENNEKVADVFDIEFYYNNKEFIGRFSLCKATTYKNKNYFMVVPCSGGTELRRNAGK